MHESRAGDVLPRSWWNDADSRLRDLEETRRKLDLQERMWNAMVAYWKRQGAPGEIPAPSPAYQPAKREETITNFP